MRKAPLPNVYAQAVILFRYYRDVTHWYNVATEQATSQKAAEEHHRINDEFSRLGRLSAPQLETAKAAITKAGYLVPRLKMFSKIKVMPSASKYLADNLEITVREESKDPAQRLKDRIKYFSALTPTSRLLEIAKREYCACGLCY